ncbi:AMP-binding protein [Amylibacter sp. IMCC11727]|uniref:class I adenylate-forming enzyme family protein n=1 Tax=Amylibacter sp. IMCC11727 TaxID=3039851 RepID=UPI00244DC17D|nr:AMP-binding protein [Amylibacter sp. IMCC11727]WGI23018.1 AMP-binding protein [Amylibacter sp. IMCC11727]
MNSFTWHPLATLRDKSGTTTARLATDIPAARTNDPDTPHIALAGFFNAIAKGQSPVIGAANTAPDTAGAFFTRTGGTTGAPKLIRRSTNSWLHSIRILQSHLSLTPASQVASVGDLSHSLTLYATVEALVTGAKMHLIGGSDLGSHAITHLYATPTQLRTIRTTVHSVNHVIVGGGPMDIATQAHVASRFPNATVTRFYGAAETSFITLASPSAPTGSVGTAFPGAEIEIRTPSGALCPADQTGQVWVRSPMLFDHYAQGSAPHTVWRGDWLTVGELGSLNTDGFLTLKGRIDRIVTIADQSVSLDDIESQLIQSGAKNAAVIALPDPLRGHVLHGFTTTDVPKHPLLKTQRTVPSLPTLSSGKTDYPSLSKGVS